MTLKLSQVIGHRGACAYAPENTLESIHTAADLGAAWVEFDVKLTKDGVPVLFHDDRLDRTTDSTGAVADIAYDDLKHLDAGSWFGASFAGAKIPTLEEAVDVLLKRGLSANIEIKPCPGREKETAEAVMDTLTRCWDETDNILISSFSHVALETAMDMAPDYPRGLLIGSESPEFWLDDINNGRLPDNWQDVADHLQVGTVHIDGNDFGRDQIEDAIDYGKPVIAYTINDPQKARQLQGWGVDAFFTDEPDTLLANLIRPVNGHNGHNGTPRPQPQPKPGD